MSNGLVVIKKEACYKIQVGMVYVRNVRYNRCILYLEPSSIFRFKVNEKL